MEPIRAQIKKAEKEKQWRKVVALTQEQLRLGNVNLSILHSAGTAYFYLKDHSKELRMASSAVKLAPRNALILWNYAHALNNADKHKKAIRVFQKIRRMSSQTILQNCVLRSIRCAEGIKNDCLFSIGNCYWNLRRWSDAACYYRKCLQRRPEVASTYSIREINQSLKEAMWRNRCDTIMKALENEQWHKAEELLIQNLKEQPSDVWCIFKLSSACYEQYQYEKALKIIKRAYSLDSHLSIIHWYYANALTMVGEFRKALAMYRKIMAKGIDRIALKSGEGIRWARSLVNDTRYRMGRAYGRLGQHKKAIYWLKEHIRHRKPGLPSLYTWTDLKESMAEFAPIKKP